MNFLYFNAEKKEKEKVDQIGLPQQIGRPA